MAMIAIMAMAPVISGHLEIRGRMAMTAVMAMAPLTRAIR